MKSMLCRSRFFSALALLAGLSYVHAVQPRWIPINGLKTATAKQAGGKGFEIRQTPNGYRLSCRMQAMFAEVTGNGVAIHSTSKGKGRGLLSLSTLLLGREQTMTALPIQAEKIAHENEVVRTIRGDIAEEFTTTGDGIRQDFVVNHAPQGSGNLVVEVGVKGATVTQKGDGILLRLAQSGRMLIYGKLNAADAAGRALPSHFELKPGSSVIDITVNDADAVYPVRIDPTISDADWSGLGSGVNNYVGAITLDDSGNVYVGGEFDTAGGKSANCIAKWNPIASVWSSLGRGVTGDNGEGGPVIWALAVDDSGNVYAGGIFDSAGGMSANNIAKWNSRTGAWSSLGSGLNSYPLTITIDDSGNVYAGGGFNTAGGVSAFGIAKWNPGTGVWSSLGSGVTNSEVPGDAGVDAMVLDGLGNLYVGGVFNMAGGVSANYIAKWNTKTGVWSSLGSGLSSELQGGLTIDDSGNLYTCSTILLRWNGSRWDSLSYVNQGAQIFALALDSSGNLYVGGLFGDAGGVSANGIARWNGSTWDSLYSGTGREGVQALAVDGSRHLLYAGGSMGIDKCIINMPKTPTLSSPSNNSMSQSIPLTLNWNSVSGVSSYDLQVSTVSTFTSIVSDQSGTTSISQTVSLSNGVTYYWRVNASNATNSSDWSSVWSFKTNFVITSAPTLVSPSNNADEQPIPLNLSWNSSTNAISYSLQVATSSNFSTTIFSQSGITIASHNMAGLATATTYYWQVNETNPVGTGPWSSVWSFATINAAPGVPVLASPTNNAQIADLPLSLNWSALAGASSYTVQISTVSNFASFFQDTTVLSNTGSVSELSGKTTYYWRVSATNALGTSTWSNVWTFSTTLNPVSVLSSSAKALEPSCFMDGTNLNYTMAQPGAVRISFSDILGREKAAINQQQSSGHYTLSLKSLNLSPGVYLIHFKAGNLEKRMRVMLSKR
ncbi:MAG: hypothetical protein ABSE00_03850 [Chitinispirillaceae bacterium]|jgi:hypothetical protein